MTQWRSSRVGVVLAVAGTLILAGPLQPARPAEGQDPSATAGSQRRMQLDDGVDAGDVALGQSWSWPDARRSYCDALILYSKEDREQKWADTFRALGQMMHLVEDTALPACVRNDPHGMATLCVVAEVLR